MSRLAFSAGDPPAADRGALFEYGNGPLVVTVHYRDVAERIERSRHSLVVVALLPGFERLPPEDGGAAHIPLSEGERAFEEGHVLAQQHRRQRGAERDGDHQVEGVKFGQRALARKA